MEKVKHQFTKLSVSTRLDTDRSNSETLLDQIPLKTGGVKVKVFWFGPVFRFGVSDSGDLSLLRLWTTIASPPPVFSGRS